MPKFLLVSSVAVIIAVIAYVVLSQNSFETTSSKQSTTSYDDLLGNDEPKTPVNTPKDDQVLTFADNLKVQFIKMGWTPKAAHEVLNLNKEWLSIQQT